MATFDIARGGHLAVVSGPRAGRSTVLRALAGAIGRYCSPGDVHLYGVDCGNNALLPLVGLPHVGAVVTRDQTDRMDRLVALRGVVSDRQQQLAMSGFADVTEQRANVPEAERLPYLVVLFDRWEGFFQAYDGLDGGRLVTAWQQIMQEGAAVGIKVVMTGDRTLTIGRMSTLFDDKLMLRMVDSSDFGAIGMTSKQVPDVDGRRPRLPRRRPARDPGRAARRRPGGHRAGGGPAGDRARRSRGVRRRAARAATVPARRAAGADRPRAGHRPAHRAVVADLPRARGWR